VFEKHIGSLQGLSVDHPVFGLSPTFHQLPFHLARKGRSSCRVCVVCVVCCGHARVLSSVCCVCAELKKINNYFSPHDKLECIWRCCQIVSSTSPPTIHRVSCCVRVRVSYCVCRLS